MALDLYAGTMTRFYSGNWENEVERFAREQGTQYVRVTPTAAKQGLPDPVAIKSAVSHWQQGLSKGISDAAAQPIVVDWSEDVTLPYFTRRLQWDPYWALILWASYLETKQPPPTKLPTVPHDDKAFVACASNPSEYEAPTFILCEYWLPLNLHFHAKFPTPVSKEAKVSSLSALEHALGKINALSWKVDGEKIQSWLSDTIDARSDLESMAMYGFAAFCDVTLKALEHQLPLALSY